VIERIDEQIIHLAKEKKYVILTNHARIEAKKDTIRMDDIVESLCSGELVEDYPEHRRGHCCLMFGWSAERPIHSVCRVIKNEILIITTYIPTLAEWQPDFKTRR